MHCVAYFLGLLYGPADSFYFLADDVESGLNWCEEQYKQNKSQLDEQRRMKNLSGKTKDVIHSSDERCS